MGTLLSAIPAKNLENRGSGEQEKEWKRKRDAFPKSDDARQAAMAKTFARELSELQEVAH